MTAGKGGTVNKLLDRVCRLERELVDNVDCEDSKAYFEAAGLLDDLEGSEENDG